MRDDAERLVRDYADLVARVSYGYLGRLEDAQDICHDVLLKALVRDEPFASADHEKAWMIRTAINTSKNYLTRAERRLAESHEDMADLAPAYLEEHDAPELTFPEGFDLSEAIAMLPPAQREAVLLRYWAGYTVGQIAADAGISPGAVSMRLTRAHATLRAVLEGACHD